MVAVDAREHLFGDIYSGGQVDLQPDCFGVNRDQCRLEVFVQAVGQAA